MYNTTVQKATEESNFKIQAKISPQTTCVELWGGVLKRGATQLLFFKLNMKVT